MARTAHKTRDGRIRFFFKTVRLVCVVIISHRRSFINPSGGGAAQICSIRPLFRFMRRDAVFVLIELNEIGHVLETGLESGFGHVAAQTQLMAAVLQFFVD